MGANLYENDFHAWANEQAALLRAGKLDAADIEHIAEEIESMGRSEKRELVSRLKSCCCTFSNGSSNRNGAEHRRKFRSPIHVTRSRIT